jgi:hypothetical protein
MLMTDELDPLVHLIGTQFFKDLGSIGVVVLSPMIESFS